MISGLHHITLNVTDLERSRRFYQALPGFVLDQDMPGYKLRFRVGTDAARLVLAPPLPGTPEEDRFTERRIGLDHLAIGVPSRAELEELLAVLARAGLLHGRPARRRSGRPRLVDGGAVYRAVV